MRTILDLPETSRIWIYQADRDLSNEECEMISNASSVFLSEWTAHGQKMDAALEIFHHKFLVIAADEQKALASGCGIDKSVNFVKDIGAKLGVDFFGRMQVAYRAAGDIVVKPLHVFWAMRKAGLIEDELIVFDNTVKNVDEFQRRWEIPFKHSWHAEMWLR